MKVTPANQRPHPLETVDRKLRVVVLDCPYDTIQSEQTQSLLGKTIALKIAAYRRQYPYGVLPADVTDFVGTHILLCEDKPEGLSPLMGFKSVTLSRCTTYRLPFPAHGVLRGSELPQHEQALSQLVSSSQERGEEIAYNSSLAIHPSVNRFTPLHQICVDMTVALFVYYYTTYSIKNVVAAATLRFKVQAVKKFAGFEYLQSGETPLAFFDCWPFFGEKVALMHLRRFRDEARLWAGRYSALWDDRLTISATADEAEGKAAA